MEFRTMFQAMEDKATTANPFSKELMDEIFKISANNDELLISRESKCLEFKENFGWASLGKYAKSMAAFANTSGGYIVFGVKNSPHIPKGLNDKYLAVFESLDPEKLTQGLNELFSPEIVWEHGVYEFNQRKFGIIYTYQSKYKPVVCIKSQNDLFNEGDIYYRYRGRSQRIKYPELRKLLDDIRIREEQLWLSHLREIATIGVDNVGIFNLSNGTTTMGNGAQFIIDENLLSSIKFIKEGEFNERIGAPAIKIIGEAIGTSKLITMKGKPTILHAKGIRLQDIILDFLGQKKIQSPLEYILQICNETTANLPLYYYQKLAQKTNEELIIAIQSSSISRSAAKSNLIKRLRENKTFHTKCSFLGSTAAQERKNICQKIENNEVVDFSNENNVLRTCECILSMEPNQITENSTKLCKIMESVFVQAYERSKATVSTKIRQTICWLDEAMFKQQQN